MGKGGAIYVAGGTLTLYNDTVADNSVQGGSGGTGGEGGKGGSLAWEMGPRAPTATPATPTAAAFYINGGSVSFFNSTVALNKQVEGDAWGRGPGRGDRHRNEHALRRQWQVDYSGNIDATRLASSRQLRSMAPSARRRISSGTIRSSPPRGWPATAARPRPSPCSRTAWPSTRASNPDDLFTDQRGYAPRTGPDGTDIGAYQHDATADTTLPDGLAECNRRDQFECLYPQPLQLHRHVRRQYGRRGIHPGGCRRGGEPTRRGRGDRCDGCLDPAGRHDRQGRRRPGIRRHLRDHAPGRRLDDFR